MTANRENAPSRWPACTALMRRAPPSVPSTASTPRRMQWCCTTRIFASAAGTASTPVPSARRNTPRSATSDRAARWTSAPSVRAVRRLTAARRNTRSTAPIGSPRASCRFARRCARRSPCSPATARSSLKSTKNGWPNAATAPERGAGKPPIVKRSQPEHAPWRCEAKLAPPAEALKQEKRHDRVYCPFAIDGGRPRLRADDRAGEPCRCAAATDFRKSQCQCGEGAATSRQTQHGEGTRYDSRHEILCARTSGGSRLAGVPSGDVEVDRGIAILGMLALLIIFYLWRGTIRIESGRSGRTIVRFNGFERFVHWLTATTFVVLGITGFT